MHDRAAIVHADNVHAAVRRAFSPPLLGYYALGGNPTGRQLSEEEFGTVSVYDVRWQSEALHPVDAAWFDIREVTQHSGHEFSMWEKYEDIFGLPYIPRTAAENFIHGAQAEPDAWDCSWVADVPERVGLRRTMDPTRGGLEERHRFEFDDGSALVLRHYAVGDPDEWGYGIHRQHIEFGVGVASLPLTDPSFGDVGRGTDVYPLPFAWAADHPMRCLQDLARTGEEEHNRLSLLDEEMGRPDWAHGLIIFGGGTAAACGTTRGRRSQRGSFPCGHVSAC